MTDAPKADDPMPAVDPKFLELLVCPFTKTRLDYDAGSLDLRSRAAGLIYAIESGVPLLTEDTARGIEDSNSGTKER